VVVVVTASVYILFVAVCGTVGVVHRSRGGWCRGVVVARRGDFLGDFRYVSWVYIIFSRYVIVLYRGVHPKFKFQVGLVVGVR
jgi:hypothetical protein